MLVRTINLSQSFARPLDWGQGPQGFWAGGGTEPEGGYRGDITYVNISTLGNSIHAGNPLQNVYRCAGTSGRGRGIIAGGDTNSGANNIIHYFQIASRGDSIDFGDLTANRTHAQAASNGERALIAGSYAGSLTSIDYITISIPGNATNFGTLTTGTTHVGDSTGNGIYGMFWLDGSPDKYDYVAIDTPGNTTVFGTGPGFWEYNAANSNGSRAFWSGGYDGTAPVKIWYLTWSTPSAGTQYGDLRLHIDNGKGVEDGSRALVGGGNQSGNIPALEYFSMDSAAGTAVVSGSFGTLNGSNTHRQSCAAFAG